MSNLSDENPDVEAAATPTGATLEHEEPVLIYNPTTREEADVIVATLQAAGIPAMLQNPSSNAGAGTIGESVGDTWSEGVYVFASNAEAARAILSAPAPTEEELTAEEEADPTTLAQAEAQVKHL